MLQLHSNSWYESNTIKDKVDTGLFRVVQVLRKSDLCALCLVFRCKYVENSNRAPECQLSPIVRFARGLRTKPRRTTFLYGKLVPSHLSPVDAMSGPAFPAQQGDSYQATHISLFVIPRFAKGLRTKPRRTSFLYRPPPLSTSPRWKRCRFLHPQRRHVACLGAFQVIS